MRSRPRILATKSNRCNAGILQLSDVSFQLIPSGRSISDTSLRKQILGIPNASRRHRVWNAIDLAIHGSGIHRTSNILLYRRINAFGEVFQLTGIHHIPQFLSTALEEYIR